jgi:1-phosphatidylinositol-3-phosphate 5-kinase
MEKYILQAPNCWHQFQGRIVGGVGAGAPSPGLPRSTVVLGDKAFSGKGKLQVMEVEGGEVERAEGSKI